MIWVYAVPLMELIGQAMHRPATKPGTMPNSLRIFGYTSGFE